MLHKYRNTNLVEVDRFEAERFDGSDEMIEKYEMRHPIDQLGSMPVIDFQQEIIFINSRWVNIEKGQWILTNDDGERLVVDDDYFRKTYERCD